MGRTHIFIFISIISCFNCTSKQNAPAMFELLESGKTGLDFSNTLTPTPTFNMFKYMYFYNGAGVGAGDFNNDGLTDLFFAGNQVQNKMFINKGGLQFTDVTNEAHIPNDTAWSTGVSVTDVNNDGLLDIYVCRVGNFETLHGKNQLLICKGIKNNIPFYEDEAAKYGLDFSGFSTQAAFLDYDLDGDLDMYLMNHSVHQNGTFNERKFFLGTYHLLSGDRIYRNDGNIFTDVTKQTGINSSAIGYGLGICVSDINLDGWPDIYIGNDFHENDYLYINQQDGTFKETNMDATMHTSQFSMGVDVADINNDAYPEIISMDMLPSDPYILKRSLGEDEYNIFYMKIRYGYHYQYTRNNLQLNNRNGSFSEAGIYAGVFATDWSWAPLWMDFDNDGLKDLFISNGIPKRMNDIDYVNYISNDEVQQKINANKVDDKEMALVNKYPEIKLPNKFYQNTGSVKFDDIRSGIKNDKPTFSNGSVYADFDNDGDLDIAVNNIADKAMLYANKSNDKNTRPYISINLKGAEKNIHAAGAKLVLFCNDSIRTYEKTSVRGFQSSMETPIHIGLYNTKVDSAFVVWPDNTYASFAISKDLSRLTLSYTKGLPVFNYSILTDHYKNKTFPAKDITAQSGFLYTHVENNFNEFDREQLMPHTLTTEGPALAIADVNNDGLEDIFTGSSKGYQNKLFLQLPNGKFTPSQQPELAADSMYEDADACFADVNNDGFKDLIIASGGNEVYGQDKYLAPRVYINNKGIFSQKKDAFANITVTQSCVKAADFNKDGFMDLFIGGRSLGFYYGVIPQSYLLLNDGTGKFTDVTQEYNKELGHAGFITNAVFTDLNKDSYPDLVITKEWDGIDAFISNKGVFTKQTLTSNKGWWNFILPCDLDNDGDTDFIAGNLGLNSRLQATKDQPVHMYYNDFDGNGRKEQILTYYLDNKEIPFANKDELQRQMPLLKKKFLYAEEFAKAPLSDLFGEDKLKSAGLFTADYFSSVVLINNGNMQFDVKPLPMQAQLTTLRDAAVVDANGDSLPDILLGENFYGNNIEMGRYDAGYGTILINSGKNEFIASALNGLIIKGEVRHILPLQVAGKKVFALARNNAPALLIGFGNK